MQRRARGQSYRASFPQARWLIAERNGEAVGELIVGEVAGCAYIIDVTVVPERQGQGLGTALVGVIMRESGPGGVRASVAVDNAASRKMFARLGFVERAGADEVNLEVVWRR
jgi:ribosomal protein S18 acetylase RimI-like enzyme